MSTPTTDPRLDDSLGHPGSVAEPRQLQSSPRNPDDAVARDVERRALEMLRRLNASNEKAVLDLGCAGRRRGSITLDRVDGPDVDLVWDLELGIPFPDNSLDGVLLFHVLEHLSSRVVEVTLAEIWRACKPGARVSIRTPHFSCGDIAWSDPTHVRPYGLRSFREYFCSSERSHFNTRFPRLPAFAPARIELHYYSFHEDRQTRLGLLATALDRIVNAHAWIQRQFERRLSYLIGGFEEVDATLVVVK